MKKVFKSICVLFTAILLLVSCEKDPVTVPPKETPPPVANAGNTQIVQLPVTNDEFTLTGSGTSINGKIVGYLWSLVSGPNIPAIASPSSTSTSVKGLQAGTYIFQFAVIDSIGLTGIDTVLIMVKPGVQKIAIIQPANNIYEGHVDSYSNSWNGGDTQFDITAWTANGSPENQRICLKFDLSALPLNAIIDTAILYLYAMPNPHGGNGVDANYGSANAGFIQRITSTWPTTVPPYTWYSQPSTTLLNQVIIPQSTSSFSNTVVDVSDLVKDMQTNGNNGFFMKLQNESTYNIRQFVTSFNNDITKHPKLIIYYH